MKVNYVCVLATQHFKYDARQNICVGSYDRDNKR